MPFGFKKTLLMESVSTDFPKIINARVRFIFFFFQENVIDYLLIFENVSFKHYSVKTFEILLKHPRTQYNIVNSQGQRYSSTDLGVYITPRKQRN